MKHNACDPADDTTFHEELAGFGVGWGMQEAAICHFQDEQGTGFDPRASGDEMAGRHYQCNEHGLRQTPGDGERQGGLACCSPRGSQRVAHYWATEPQQAEVYMKGMNSVSPEVCILPCIEC